MSIKSLDLAIKEFNDLLTDDLKRRIIEAVKKETDNWHKVFQIQAGSELYVSECEGVMPIYTSPEAREAIDREEPAIPLKAVSFTRDFGGRDIVVVVYFKD